MIAAESGRIKDLPRCFYHSELVRNYERMTVAMIAAESCCIEDLP